MPLILNLTNEPTFFCAAEQTHYTVNVSQPCEDKQQTGCEIRFSVWSWVFYFTRVCFYHTQHELSHTRVLINMGTDTQPHSYASRFTLSNHAHSHGLITHIHTMSNVRVLLLSRRNVFFIKANLAQPELNRNISESNYTFTRIIDLSLPDLTAPKGDLL